MFALIGAPMCPRPMKPTRTPAPLRSPDGPPGHRILVDLGAQAGQLRHPDAPVRIYPHRLGQEEVASLLRPSRRIMGELQERAAADSRRDMQVREQPEPVSPGVRGEPAAAL